MQHVSLTSLLPIISTAVPWLGDTLIIFILTLFLSSTSANKFNAGIIWLIDSIVNFDFRLYEPGLAGAKLGNV